MPIATPAGVPAPIKAVVGRLPIGTGAYGTAHPMLLRAYDRNERWMALCQARKDTDGDGKIEVHSGHHGWIVDYNDDLVELATGAIKGKATGAIRLAATGRVLKGPGKDMQGPLTWSAP